MGRYTGNASLEDINPLAADEVGELLENVYQATDFALYTLFLLAARSGLRIGEILALEWPDIDFEARTLEVSKSWAYSKRTMGSPKNGKPRKVESRLW